VNLLRRIAWWLKGRYVCVRCGEVWYAFNFGYGDFICPLCFKGENHWRWERSVVTGMVKGAYP